MKIKKAAVLLLPFLLILLWGCTVQDYPTYTYELSNDLGEKYLVNYCEETGYPDNITRVKVFADKKKICDYDGGAYSGCDSYVPVQIIYICSADNVDYYYLQTRSGEYLAADGVADLKLNFNLLLLGKPPAEMTDTEKRTYSKLANIIRGAVSAESAEKRFSSCRTSSAAFMSLYGYDG